MTDTTEELEATIRALTCPRGFESHALRSRVTDRTAGVVPTELWR